MRYKHLAYWKTRDFRDLPTLPRSLEKVKVQQFCPSNIPQRNPSNLTVPVRNVFKQHSFPDYAFPDFRQLHVHNYRTIFQMQVHVSPKVRFGAVQAKILHRFSPVNLFLRETAPTLPADGKFFPFKKNIQFDVLTIALVLPRVFTTLQTCKPPRLPQAQTFGIFLLLRQT